jgi:lysophospholipase L1-like esterase
MTSSSGAGRLIAGWKGVQEQHLGGVGWDSIGPYRGAMAESAHPTRIRLAPLCVALGIVAAFPASALADPASNDDFANAQNLGNGSTASASGTNLDATAEPGEPDHNRIPATASVWYRWTAPADGEVRIDACGSDFDTVLAVYTGSALHALTPVESNDDSCGWQSEVAFDATAGVTYRIALDGVFGDRGSIELELAEGGSAALYVALGDSVAAGSGTYVDRLFPHYRAALGVTRLSNRAVGGETSGSIRTRGQLDRALGDIKASSDTRAVTIDIGGNDRFECADKWASCPFRANLAATISDLRAALDADPGAEAFAAMAYYNPASGLGGDGPHSESYYDRGLLGTDLVIDCEITTGPRVGINDVIHQEARRHGALVADPYPAFKRGGQGFMGDSIHPNDAGHAAIADAFREASAPCPREEPPGRPSNEFGFGKLKRNEKRGTAKLVVEVPGPGELQLAKTKRVKADEESAEAKGNEKLSVKPWRETRKKLNWRGKARVEAKVTYTPEGGDPNTESKRVKLVKRRRERP